MEPQKQRRLLLAVIVVVVVVVIGLWLGLGKAGNPSPTMSPELSQEEKEQKINSALGQPTLATTTEAQKKLQGQINSSLNQPVPPGSSDERLSQILEALNN